ncbi:hypothetical protein V1525DRAFT_425495 [Lipomyces kononenkoae]|uniref:Uncharacterized protein n=1 Tax=Lipomyces kononenkoae TaxID=34357 RepID=A0ACC3T3K7_LIPKO
MSSAEQVASPNRPSPVESTSAQAPSVLVKVNYNHSIRRFRLAPSVFRSATFPSYLKSLLEIPETTAIIIERYSTTHHGFTPLDSKSSYESLRNSIFVKGKAKLNVQEGVALPRTESSATTSTNEAVPSSEEKASPAPSLEDLTASVYATLQSQESQEMIRSMVSEEVAKLATNLKSLLSIEKNSESIKPDETSRSRIPRCPVAEYTIRCDICNRDITTPTYYHCNDCQSGDFDICSSCIKEGRHCLDDSHHLEACSIGKGISVSVELNDDVSHLSTPSESTPRDFPHRRGPHDRLHSRGHSHPHPHFSPHFMRGAGGGCGRKWARPFEAANVNHHAFCDSCDTQIRGIRYKCVNCPDFDYCGSCFKSASTTHPGHSFVQIAHPSAYFKVATDRRAMHFGILCDGPLCKDSKHCIVGDRYKCAICENYDLCENCEALPNHPHDVTHPMIKLKTPLRNLTVDALEKKPEQEVVDTEVDAMKVEEPDEKDVVDEKQVDASVDLINLDAEANKSVQENAHVPENAQLSSSFIEQAIKDGTVCRPGELFFQSWSLKNNGSGAWPAGVTLAFAGGDKMFVHQGIAANASISPFEVQPGESACFAAMLQAPKTEGLFVSFWKLVTAEGERFGDNLWCQIRVAAAKDAGKDVASEEELTKSKYSDASDMMFPVLNVSNSSTTSSVIAHAGDETASSVTTVQPESVIQSIATASEPVDHDVAESEAASSTVSGEDLSQLSDDDYEIVEDSEGSVW